MCYFLFVRPLTCLMFLSGRVRRALTSISSPTKNKPEVNRSSGSALIISHLLLFIPSLSSSLLSENELPSYDSVEEKVSHLITYIQLLCSAAFVFIPNTKCSRTDQCWNHLNKKQTLFCVELLFSLLQVL